MAALGPDSIDLHQHAGTRRRMEISPVTTPPQRYSQLNFALTASSSPSAAGMPRWP